MNDDDIRYTFEAIDESKAGEISLAQFYDLFFGLGFATTVLDQNAVRLMVARTVRKSGQSMPSDDSTPFITLDLVLEVLTAEGLKNNRDRKSELSECYQLLDKDSKGGITAADLQRLSEEVGDPVSLETAKDMIRATLDTVDSLSTTRVSKSDFQELMSLPR